MERIEDDHRKGRTVAKNGEAGYKREGERKGEKVEGRDNRRKDTGRIKPPLAHPFFI